jgi:hypothetical protein
MNGGSPTVFALGRDSWPPLRRVVPHTRRPLADCYSNLLDRLCFCSYGVKRQHDLKAWRWTPALQSEPAAQRVFEEAARRCSARGASGC